MQIFVKLLNWDFITLEVDLSTTVDELKTLISKKWKAEGSEHKYHLYYRCSEYRVCKLDNNRTLGEYGISKVGTRYCTISLLLLISYQAGVIFLVLSLEGGAVNVVEFSSSKLPPTHILSNEAAKRSVSEDTNRRLSNPHEVPSPSASQPPTLPYPQTLGWQWYKDNWYYHYDFDQDPMPANYDNDYRNWYVNDGEKTIWLPKQ